MSGLLAVFRKEVRENIRDRRALFNSLLLGPLLFPLLFVGLALAVVSGFTFVDNLFAQHLAHKTILSIFAWFVFALLLWGRWKFGWRGRKAIRWTLSGFGLLILAYFGSKLVLEIILDGVA